MQVAPGIFKAYDIRGVVPDTVDIALAEAIGRVVGSWGLGAGERSVAVGRDGRLSGPALADALIDGLLATGIDVLDLGLVTTPLASFAATTLTRSVVQVTASHNPRDHNGFKLLLAGRTVHGDDIQRLRRAIEAQEWTLAATPGTLREADVLPAYLERIRGDIELARPLKIVLDCGNGVAGDSSPAVFRAIGCEVVELFTDVDGRFPHHHPDPAKPENLQDLLRAVRETGADLGLALDGDGDRLGVVTPSGGIVWPDRQMVLFARDVLARHAGAPIVFDVKSTQRLREAVVAAGGQPVMDKSGYVLIKDRMRELNAPFAGEMSGHLFFNDRWPGFDDGTYAGCRLLEIVSREADPGAALDALPTSCSTPELHIPCAEGEAHRVAAELAARADFADGQVCTLDGLRVDWPDGFGLVRASNTTPVLTVRFEGHTPEAMERIQSRMLEALRQVKPDAAIGAPRH